MMKTYKNTFIPLLLILASIVIYSCSKNESQLLDVDNSIEIKRNAIIELTELSKEVFSSKSVRDELYLLGVSDYFSDQYIPLRDLLNPDESLFYRDAKIPSDIKGSYKRAYESLLNDSPNEYINLKLLDHSVSRSSKSNTSYTYNGLSYYCPYCLDYSQSSFTPTLVPELTDADIGPGYEPSSSGYVTTMVDDSYAEITPTLLIGPDIDPSIKDEPDFGNSGNSNHGQGCNCTQIRQVFVGHVRLDVQYDHWISFTGNGGASEIQILRVGDPLIRDNSGNLMADAVPDNSSVTISRRDIRRDRWIWAADLWDNDWGCEPFEQMLIIYEEDTEEDVSISGSIAVDSLASASANIFIQVRTQDEIISQQVRDWREFFTVNTLDNGCGTMAGENVFSSTDWAIYECGSDFEYTMPHRCL